MRAMSLVIAVMLFLGSLGCSAATRVTAPNTSQDQSASYAGSRLWGIYDVSIDPDTLEATAVPNRTAEMRIDVNTFMNGNPASLKLFITDATKLKTTGELTLNVSLTHPVNKPKLAGFDVHCILMSNGTDYLNYDSTMIYPVEGTDTVLMNPDGWTRWFNAIEFTTPGIFGFIPGKLGKILKPTATLNGYKLYADGLAFQDDPATFLEGNFADRSIFRPGATNTREWKLRFALSGGKPVLKYQYAVVASWAPPSNSNPQPADFPPEADIQEAAHIKIDTSQSTMYYTPAKSGGDLIVNAEIFDWQGAVSGMYTQASRIVVESDALSVPYMVQNPDILQNVDNPYGTWSATIPADNLKSADPVRVWVIVVSKFPSDYKNVTGPVYPKNAKLSAVKDAMATVSNTVPIEPPQILSGVDICSGTTQCPDRSKDNAAVFCVTVKADLPVTYQWTVIINKPGSLTGDPVTGFNKVPGDGKGHLNVDFTKAVFASCPPHLRVACTVTDGVHDPIGASAIEIWLDCIIFDANLNDSKYDNSGWTVKDSSGTSGTVWKASAAKDSGTKLGSATGALWQETKTTKGVTAHAKAMLITELIEIPPFLSSAYIKVDHYYSFSPITMGGNIRYGPLGTLTLVTQPFSPISSGDDYDGTLTDSSCVMYPQSVFSTNGVSTLHTSIIDLTPADIGSQIQIGFAAASGASAYPDGGWLIDHVQIIATQ